MSNQYSIDRVFGRTLQELSEVKTRRSKRRLYSADSASSFSDLLSWSPDGLICESALDHRLALVVISFMGLTEFNLSELYKKIYLTGQKYRWEGKWASLQKHLKKAPIPFQQLSLLLEDYNCNDYYGNLLPRMKTILSTMIAVNPYTVNRKRPRRTARKRGHDDKGHHRVRKAPNPAVPAPDTNLKKFSDFSIDQIWQATQFGSYPA